MPVGLRKTIDVSRFQPGPYAESSVSMYRLRP